jgi:hypothetical protein
MSEDHDKIERNNEKDTYKEIKAEPDDKEIQTEIETRDEENSESVEIKEKSKIIPKLKIDLERQRYPYCIVWTPIPCITWILPSIGHAGICTSEGVIHDFAGPYFVSVDNMAFGNPTKYIFLDLDSKERERYDDAIEGGKDDYMEQMYSFCCNNCHSFIARCLNKLKYKGKTNYTMVHVWWMLCIKSKFISFSKFLQSYLGFIIIVIIILVIYFTTNK